jgi:hypothetical protein
MASIEDLLAQARPVTRTARLCLRGDLIAAREDAERRLLAARIEDDRSNEPDTAPAIAEEIVALEAEQDAAGVEFTVRALSRTAWQKLLEANPATEQDEKNGLDYGAGFPTAAIAACCSDPEMTLDQVNQLLDVISTNQYMLLWGTVMAVNLGADDLPKSVAATATLHSSGAKSTTAPPAESLGASS